VNSNLVKAVRDYANANYNKGGWDIIVECWSDADIAGEIGSVKTISGAIRKVRRVVRVIGDYRSEIQNA
jgi:hypothetical protein